MLLHLLHLYMPRQNAASRDFLGVCVVVWDSGISSGTWLCFCYFPSFINIDFFSYSYHYHIITRYPYLLLHFHYLI